MMIKMLSLPDEMINEILQYPSDDTEITSLCFTCKRFFEWFRNNWFMRDKHIYKPNMVNHVWGYRHIILGEYDHIDLPKGVTKVTDVRNVHKWTWENDCKDIEKLGQFIPNIKLVWSYIVTFVICLNLPDNVKRFTFKGQVMTLREISYIYLDKTAEISNYRGIYINHNLDYFKTTVKYTFIGQDSVRHMKVKKARFINDEPDDNIEVLHCKSIKSRSLKVFNKLKELRIKNFKRKLYTSFVKKLKLSNLIMPKLEHLEIWIKYIFKPIHLKDYPNIKKLIIHNTNTLQDLDSLVAIYKQEYPDLEVICF